MKMQFGRILNVLLIFDELTLNLLLSSCLLSLNCRYDAKKKKHSPFVDKMVSQSCSIMSICPEYSAVMKVPRNKIFLNRDSSMILNEDGENVTGIYKIAFSNLTKRAINFNPDIIILKEKSPSCALSIVSVYNEGKSNGIGVFAKHLKKSVHADFFNELGENF